MTEAPARVDDRTQVVILPYTRPFEWPAMLAFFRARAIAGVEVVGTEQYRRTIGLETGSGMLTLSDDAAAGALIATVVAPAPVASAEIEARLRRNLDLDADLAAVTARLSHDPVLARAIALRPAVRIPGHWDPFETAIRAVLGQQVSLAAARMLAGRLVERAGDRIGQGGDGEPDRVFPTPAQILAADLSAMGMPGARVRTLLSLSEVALADTGLFRRGASLDETVARLSAVKGIGPWTAQYIALRACREPDAFPASDVGLLRGMAVDGRRPTPAELEERAEAWRPFRAYAAHHIWASDAGSNIEPSAPAGTRQ